jgi:hypothetical protein
MNELILIAVIVIQAIIHFIERRDMLNHFSSSNHKDTKHKAPPKHIPSAHSKVLKRWKSTIPIKAGDE